MHHPGVFSMLPRKADAGQAEDGFVFAQEEEGSEDPAVLGEVLVRAPEASVSFFWREKRAVVRTRSEHAGGACIPFGESGS